MVMRSAVLILSTFVTFVAPCRAQEARLPSIVVAGWIERVSFPDHAIDFEAKLDTGADSSSVHGRGIELFQREGKRFVRFTLTDDSGKSVQIEAPVARSVKVKRAGSDLDSRPVVRLNVCVGDQFSDVDFTVADRADMNFQVLIGRNVLAGRILVDSSQRHIVSSKCDMKR